MQRVSDSRIIEFLAEAAVQLVPQFISQTASCCLWAVAKLGVSDVRILAPLAEAAVRLVPQFDAQVAASDLPHHHAADRSHNGHVGGPQA